MKKTYQAPAMERTRIEAQQMIALSIVPGRADNSTVYVEEEKAATTAGSNVWGQEW